MNEILTSMVELIGTQALALQAVADHTSALEHILKTDPQFAADLKRQIEAEQKKSKVHVQKLQTTLAKLREAVSRLAN